MSIKILFESDSAKRDRLRLESIERAMQAINVSVAKLDHSDKTYVYSVLLDKLGGRASAKIRRKAVTAYHKGARH